MRRATRQWEPSRNVRGTVEDARRLLAQAGRVVLLTGAGISTESGVPDYRGPSAIRATPMMYQDYVRSEETRRRYWARNFQGWSHTRHTTPNAGHRAIAAWEQGAGPARFEGLITQNVDGLHEAAGSRQLVALHGRSSRIVCLDCGARSTRAALQERLAALNPWVVQRTDLGPAELRPDSDAVVEDWRSFQVAPCLVCGGVLMVDVVFFGDSVPKDRVDQAFSWCDEADAMLVAGSSLTVMSGLRFARHMARQTKPLVVVNHGATRADDLADVRLDAAVGQVLAVLVGQPPGATSQ